MKVSACLVTRGDVDLWPVIESLPDEWEIVCWENGRSVSWRRPPGWACERNGMRYEFPEGAVGADFGQVDIAQTQEGVSWQGGQFPDLAVYGRYAAIEYATGDLIYVQDDDCVLPQESLEALVRAWIDKAHALTVGWHGVNVDAPWEGVICNMPEPFRHDFYAEHSLVGFGSVFHRDAPARAFERFMAEPTRATLAGGSQHGLVFPGWLPDYLGVGDFFNRTCDVVFTALTPRVLVDVPYANLPWADGPDRMYRQPEHVAERKRMLELALKVRDAEAARA